MTDREYEQKKRECWEEFCNEHLFDPHNIVTQGIFGYAFDRAYALGKEKETITQEEIEKAAEKYAEQKTEQYIPESYGDIRHRRVAERFDSYDMEQAFEDGANFALGKQEKDAEDTVISGWVARDQDGYVSLFKDKPIRDTCDKDDIPYGFWDDVDGNCIDLPITLFPDLTWSDEPQEVEIIIKRKKK